MKLARALVLPLLAGWACLAAADVPSPSNSTIPCGIRLAGLTNSVPDAAAKFEIVVRKLSNQLVQGSTVVIEFVDCKGPTQDDVRIAADQQAAGVYTYCQSGTEEVRGITGADGAVRMTVIGGGFPTPHPGYATPPDCNARYGGCARVYADGVLLGYMSVGLYDEDGVNGLNPVDVSMWLADALHTPYSARSDLDFDGTVAPPDLSLWLSAFFGNGSRSSATAYCQ